MIASQMILKTWASRFQAASGLGVDELFCFYQKPWSRTAYKKRLGFRGLGMYGLRPWGLGIRSTAGFGGFALDVFFGC